MPQPTGFDNRVFQSSSLYSACNIYTVRLPAVSANIITWNADPLGAIECSQGEWYPSVNAAPIPTFPYQHSLVNIIDKYAAISMFWYLALRNENQYKPMVVQLHEYIKSSVEQGRIWVSDFRQDHLWNWLIIFIPEELTIDPRSYARLLWGLLQFSACVFPESLRHVDSTGTGQVIRLYITRQVSQLSFLWNIPFYTKYIILPYSIQAILTLSDKNVWPTVLIAE